ncbi:S-formylglutathione hydrolase-like [Oppia nitens]|uniref:S-formylglutathione hydrolase-like n=1 Tax=Oppia nitens TaxID=1686743 RepID=UPI0023DABAE5|nr:S-formylglutathione hydrolase-like [Oppia nitens]
MSTIVSLVSSSKCFGGKQEVYSHESEEVKCKMTFSVYIPPKALDGQKVPVLYWLSGLTCTEQNFIIKSGFQRYAAEEGLIVVGPDTSPRGLNIDGEDTDYDLGTGAGFYVDATQDKWKTNYRMFSYVTKELPKVIEANFPIITGCQSIFGHSMGGHGALICALKNPGLYKSVTSFSPIANPVKGKWGQKNLSAYLGSDQTYWQQWDATYLVQKYNGPPLHLIIDQGSADPYLHEELMVKNFEDACVSAKVPVKYQLRDGYDHSFFFVATFIGEHIKHHSTILYQSIA